MTAPARLLLVRHGGSAHAHGGGWLDAAGVHAWRAAYDAAGIAADDAPPPSLVAACAGDVRLACSDAPRARASAARLAAGRMVLASPLLRESPLAIPDAWGARLPLAAWDALIHAAWGARILRGTDASPVERQRAAAAAWLGARARAREASPASVVAVTHGVFRRLLDAALRADGWRAASARRARGATFVRGARGATSARDMRGTIGAHAGRCGPAARCRGSTDGEASCCTREWGACRPDCSRRCWRSAARGAPSRRPVRVASRRSRSRCRPAR